MCIRSSKDIESVSNFHYFDPEVHGSLKQPIVSRIPLCKWNQAGGRLQPLLYNNNYTDDLNHLLQETGVGCYVGGTRVNSLSYADNMVLLSNTITAFQTIFYVCHSYDGPHDVF